MSEKTAAMARFAFSRPRDERSGARMRAWNELYPDWAFTHAGHFTQECRSAVEKVGRATANQERMEAARPHIQALVDLGFNPGQVDRMFAEALEEDNKKDAPSD